MTIHSLIHRFALYPRAKLHMLPPGVLQQFACPTFPASSPLSPTPPQTAKKEPRRGKNGELLTRVEDGRGWAKQRQAESSAQITPIVQRVQIPYFSCDLCQVSIGPDYVEQELWLYHVNNETVCFGCDYKFVKGSRWLHICGGCARYKKRQLPDIYCVVRPEYWLTTILLQEQEEDSGTNPRERPLRIIDQTNEEEVLRVRHALDQHVARMYTFHLFLLFAHFHIPTALISALFASASTAKRKRAVLPLERAQVRVPANGADEPEEVPQHARMSPIHSPGKGVERKRVGGNTR